MLVLSFQGVSFVQAVQAELEAARLLKQKEEEEAKQAAQQAKKEKEIQKKAIKKERQKLRATCKVWSHQNNLWTLVRVAAYSWPLSWQNWNYFADNEADSVKMMEEVEKLCDRLELARYYHGLQIQYLWKASTPFNVFSICRFHSYKNQLLFKYIGNFCVKEKTEFTNVLFPVCSPWMKSWPHPLKMKARQQWWSR